MRKKSLFYQVTREKDNAKFRICFCNFFSAAETAHSELGQNTKRTIGTLHLFTNYDAAEKKKKRVIE